MINDTDHPALLAELTEILTGACQRLEAAGADPGDIGAALLAVLTAAIRRGHGCQQAAAFLRTTADALDQQGAADRRRAH